MNPRVAARGLAAMLLAGTVLGAGVALADEVPDPPKKDEGCGCRTANNGHALGALSLVFMGAGVVLMRRAFKRAPEDQAPS